MSADVNEDEEIYTDGTSITNITVAGVREKVAMFAGGAKPGVASKPVPSVLQRFQEKAAEAGQTNFSTFGKSSETSAGSPGVRNFGKPAAGSQSGSGVPVTPPKPKPGAGNTPSPQPSWKRKTPDTNTDQNQNVTNTSSLNPNVTSVSPVKKRGSVTIPDAFQSNSTAQSPGRKISIDEKSSVQNGTVPSAQSPQSPVSSTPTVNKADDGESGTKINFRANLRPTAAKGTGAPKPIEIHPRQRTPSQDDKPISPPGSGGGIKSPLTGQPSSKPLKRITPSKTVITRQDDGKKFERVPKSSIITLEMAPIKPLKPKEVNVNDIIEEFKKAYDDFKYANEELYDDVGNFIRHEEEEEYDDVGNVVDQRSSKRRSNRPISEIPTWSEEDELGSGGSVSASGSGSGGSAAVLAPTQEELYDDGTPQESDELYEPLPDEDVQPEPTVDNSAVDKKEQERKEKEAAEKRKREEKERKEREKEEKKEQARREKEEKARIEKEKKKEKELKDLMKKLKMTGNEQTEAQGVVKEKGKGGRLDLAVQPGEKVDILRMTDNPKGKWLVRNKEGSYGYVESENILIETPTIKQAMIQYIVQLRPSDYLYTQTAMKLVDNPLAEGNDGQEEMYEDLDGYQDNMEEIYEECS